MLDLGDGDIVQPPGLLFPVTADERNGVSLLEKVDAILHLPILDTDGTGDIVNIDILHIQSVINNSSTIASRQLPAAKNLSHVRR